MHPATRSRLEPVGKPQTHDLRSTRELTYSSKTRVSECISFQSLNQTIRQLGDLRELYLPRCSSRYEPSATPGGPSIRWPPKLEHLALSGSVSGQFLWDMLRQPDNFPPTFSSLSIHHSPGLDQYVETLLQRSHRTTATGKLNANIKTAGKVSDPYLTAYLHRLPSSNSAIYQPSNKAG